MRTLIGLLLFTFLTTNMVFSNDSIVGHWRTIDDQTGEVKAIVELSSIDGKLNGTIIKLFNKDPNYNPNCDQCKDHLKGEKIIGMQIIYELDQINGKWHGKKGVLDPGNGKYYDCKIWINEQNPDELHIRGYFFFFLYRTQTWHREKTNRL